MDSCALSLRQGQMLRCYHQTGTLLPQRFGVRILPRSAEASLNVMAANFKVRKGKKVKKDIEYPWPDQIPTDGSGPHVFTHLHRYKPLEKPPKKFLLPFEIPIDEIKKKLEMVKNIQKETGTDCNDMINALENKYLELTKDIYESLTPIQRLSVARHPNRPTCLEHVSNISDKWLELHGDRAGHDDRSIVTGIGTIDGISYMFIGHQKGRNTKENLYRNFGMPTPHGYRKALRIMKEADRFGLPIITFVDTPGAYASIESERKGQGESIAQNLRSSFGLKVPVISIVIGEGGSGGALAIGTCNRMLMLENAVYFVASPEAAAAILYNSSKESPRAANRLKITAHEHFLRGIADEIIAEPLGAAHSDPLLTSANIKEAVLRNLQELRQMSPEDLKEHRKNKFFSIGKSKRGKMNERNLRYMKLADLPMSEARGNIKPVNLNRIAIPDIQDHIGSEKKTKSANLYPFAMPDKQENTRPEGKTDPANLYPHAMPYNQENTESERQTQGEGQNIRIAADSCRQAPMEANTPFIATPAKLNNLLPLPIVPKAENQLALPIIPKAEYVSEYTPKLRIECGTRPVHSASLNSDNLSLVPKREIGNSGIMAFLEAQVQGGSASASIVSHMNTQVVPNAEELRSALAKSLKRYKDLTVLHPGSTAVERRGSLTMSVDNTDTEAGSRKRKRARPTRPRPVIHNPYPSVSGNDREIVMRALVTYDALRRHLRDETRRPDLQAGVLMIDKGLAVNRDRRIVGAIPGVNVGDHFYFRMELCVISLHCPTQAGIDYITAKNSEWHEPIATSIIASGGYEDNEDGGEELIYTGHGGNNYVMDKKQSVDQKLERGNFALERSKHYQIEIRVIRGIKDSGSPSGKIYIYDGLYKVVDSWLDRGRSGSGVFKYKLHRTPGQPELGSAILKNTRRWKSEPTLRVGLVHPDISLRSENLPVCLVNDVDNEKGPPHFEYATTVRYPDSLVSISQGCECVGGCSTGGSCSCIQKNGGQMPYNANGILIKGKPLVYECGIHCKCPPSCWNRSTQKGLNVSLEIFRTRGTNANANGWGVRSLDPIAAGSFICEYTGEVVPTEGADADQQSIMDSEYVLNPRRQVSECGDVSHILAEQLQDASSMLACPPTPANLDFLIDASKIGNVSRFINHGSFPNANVFMQFVLHDHLDCRFPHVMLFALYHIPPLTELLLDYKEQTVLNQPKEEKNFIQQKEEVETGSAFECSHSVVKIEPYYT